MRLTTHSDLSFKVLIFLGTAGRDGATIARISAAFGSSEHHLRKVAQELVQLKLVAASRGRSGGLRLAIDPATVTIGDLMRLFEPEFARAECLGAAQNGCVIFGCCGLQGVFRESLAAQFAVFDRYTLADVLRDSPGAAFRLGMVAASP